DAREIEGIWDDFMDLWIHKSPEYKRVEASAIRFAKLLGDSDIGNLTQGMIPVSVIRSWFYTVQGAPYPSHMPRGAVKIPALWGYEEKRKAGQFCDGYGNGEIPGWAVAVELVAGQSPETVRHYFPKV